MNCPMCGAWVKVISVRKNSDGNQRRYECKEGHRFSTQESITPIRDVLKGVSTKNLHSVVKTQN